MSYENTAFGEFNDRTIEHLKLLHREICEFSEYMSENDSASHSLAQIKRKMLVLVFEALMSSCDDLPQYDFNMMPEWMRRVARSQGTNPVPSN